MHSSNNEKQMNNKLDNTRMATTRTDNQASYIKNLTNNEEIVYWYIFLLK